MIVEKKAQANKPGRALLDAVRQHETHGPDDMWCGAQQHLALDQRLSHEPEFVVLEIAKAAVNELAAARGGALCQVVLLAEQDRETAPGRVAGNSNAVDSSADDQKIK